MAILVMCPDKACGELFEVPESAVGQEVRCPACGALQTIAPPPRMRAATEEEQAAPPPARGIPQARPEEDQPIFVAADEGESQEEAFFNEESSPVPSAAGRSPAPVEEEGEMDLSPSDSNEVDLAPADEEEEADDFMPVHSRREVRSLYSHPRPQPEPEPPSGGFLIPDELDEDVPPAMGLFAEQIHDEEEKEENKLVVVAVVAVGGIGTLAGMLAGVGLGGQQPVIGALLGAGAGWIIGVLATFMLILAHPKDELPKVRCRTCGNVFPGETETCKWCGSELPGPGVSPLTAGCLNSHHYATSNAKSVASLTALLAIPTTLLLGAFRLPQAVPQTPAELTPLLIGLSVLVGFLIGTCWLRHFLSVVGATLMNHDRAPNAPKVWDLHNIAVGIKGAGALCLYLVPVFTIPLLPLGLLRLGAPRQDGAYDLGRNARAALAHARDFAALWLWQLLWLAVMAFASAVTILLFNLTDLIPEMDPAADMIVATLLDGAKIAIFAAAAAVCGTAIFRCMGLFGRENARQLILYDDYQPPASPDAPVDDDEL